LTTPATELLFEALDQFDQEPGGVFDIAEHTHFVDRRDKIEIFRQPPRALTRTPPSSLDTADFNTESAKFVGGSSRTPPSGGDREVRRVMLARRTLPATSNCQTIELPTHLMCRSTYPNADKPFLGAIFDTGAPRSVVGLSQAEAYAKFLKITLNLKEACPVRFSFGGRQSFQSLGDLVVRVPMHQSFIPHRVEVVNVDVPLLLGMDFLNKHRVIVDVTRNVLIHRQSNASQPLARKHGHVYIEWDSNILFTHGELVKLHKNFFHPTVNNLMDLFKCANIQDLPVDARESLEDITARCDTCQTFTSKPYHFRVSMPDSIVFNHTLAIDLVWLEGNAAFHVVDLHMYLSAAGFLQR
jgi:hypothetical protein